MRFKHTNRPGFLLGFIDFFTAGLFFLLYMPFGGLQDELEVILGHKLLPYWKAYLLGIPTLFIYTLVWMALIAEELKVKANELGIEGPYTSWWHKQYRNRAEQTKMTSWNMGNMNTEKRGIVLLCFSIASI